MEHAKLDALVHGKQQCVSFRHLSALLSVPARSAQKLLLSYIHSQPSEKLSVLWVVSRRDQRTNAVKTVLTASPSATETKQIWAVGPATAASAPSLHAAWIALDTNRERELVKRPSHEPNELRDGRFNVLKSSTVDYDQRIDPRLGGDANLVTKSSTEKKKSSSFLSMVKSKTKAKKSKQASFSFKKPASNAGSSSSLFNSKPLGADSVRKIKADERAKTKEPNGKNNLSSPTPPSARKSSAPNTGKSSGEDRRKKKNGKKARKIVVQADSDSEDRDSEEEVDEQEAIRRKMEEERDEEMDEEQRRIMELEEEEALADHAAAERAELEKELVDLQDTVEEEPESPVLQDMDAEMKDVEHVTPEKGQDVDDSPNKGKRSYWDTLNHTPTQGRRIRKEVQELVEENGYFVTRRVIKVFDEDGKEVSDDDGKDAEKEEEERKKKAEESSASLRSLFTPLKNKKSNRSKSSGTNGKSGQPSSPTASQSKKTVKRKSKSIKSYFQKRV
ncbi:DNA polymerase subunit Cdc27 [Gracilaria domingensis]|nr:DNA polymerase subunit Cdc27 [Gracilaria domingensis]